MSKGYYRRHSDRVKARLLRNRRSVDGALKWIYDHQRTRSGYVGKAWKCPTYSKQELVDKYIHDPVYLDIHRAWVESGYSMKLAPSIDRINYRRGYSFDNIQMLTWEANRVKGFHEHFERSVDMLTRDGVFVKSYHSFKEAGADTGLSPANILKCCSGRYINNKTCGGYRWRYTDCK
jgi:hypothetical protein